MSLVDKRGRGARDGCSVGRREMGQDITEFPSTEQNLDAFVMFLTLLSLAPSSTSRNVL